MSLETDRIEAWRRLLAAHTRLLERVEGALKAAGLPPLAWYDVLLALSRAPGGRLRMHELAEAMLLSRSNLTRLADRLERAGLIARAADPEDRRGAFAVITEAGEAKRREMWPVYRGAIERHFGRHLSGAEARELAALLGRVMGEGGDA